MSGPIATSDVAPSCVRPGLYLGSAGAIPESVDATGISHVLVCAAELRCEVACAQRRHSCAATPQQQPQLRSATPQHQQGAYSCMHLTLWDEPACDVVAALRAAIPFIDAGRAAGGVLVCCAQGVSRSAALLCGYMMLSGEALTYEDALQQLRACRPAVAPNAGFAAQLQELGRLGRLDAWPGWGDGEAAAAAAATTGRSGRRIVSGRSEVLRTLRSAARRGGADPDSTAWHDSSVILLA